MRNLFDGIGFHYVVNLPSGILGVEINVELFNILNLGAECTA